MSGQITAAAGAGLAALALSRPDDTALLDVGDEGRGLHLVSLSMRN
jgi:hypothetical protein